MSDSGPQTGSKELSGAVLVCGGGIAGIQASLDLSAAGFRVYLVEESPTIGGQMARLDKTFPTGDCATCIISPKLVECMRDHNIDVITMADLQRLEGEAGHFTATIRKRPRSVDEDKCTGCGDCWQHCPVLNLPDPPAKAEPGGRLEAKDQALLEAILARHQGEQGKVMAILQEIQDRFGSLPRPVLEETAVHLDTTAAELLRVATFYHEFRMEPSARHVVEVCKGTSCYARGSGALHTRLEEEIGKISDKERFELSTVRCLGLCALSPSMKIDDVTFGRVSPDKVPGILERFE